MEKSGEALIDVIKDVGLEINAEKINHDLTSRHQNSRENNNIEIPVASRSFENAAPKGNRWAKLRTFIVQEVDRVTARGVSSAVLW
jgi:hypothetical protein